MPDDPVDDQANPSREAYLQAVRQAEEDHPLPGENPASRDPADAQLWLTTYAELLRFKAAVIAVAEERQAGLSEPARDEVRATDLRILEAERARFERRHAYWQGRKEMLGA